MIKIMLLCSLFVCCGWLGINIGNTFNEKYNFYMDLRDFCNHMKNNITFLKTDVLAITNNYKPKSKLKFLLQDVSNAIKEKVVLNEMELLSLLQKYSYLNQQDKNLLANLFCNLGSVGYDEQIAKIEYSISQTEFLMNDFKQNKYKFANLSKKMGFIIGLLVCIVLI